MSPTVSPRRREVVLEDLTGLPAASAISRLRELELRPAVEACDTERADQHGRVLAHEPCGESTVRRAQLITLLVGQHCDGRHHAKLPQPPVVRRSRPSGAENARQQPGLLLRPEAPDLGVEADGGFAPTYRQPAPLVSAADVVLPVVRSEERAPDVGVSTSQPSRSRRNGSKFRGHVALLLGLVVVVGSALVGTHLLVGRQSVVHSRIVVRPRVTRSPSDASFGRLRRPPAMPRHAPLHPRALARSVKTGVAIRGKTPQSRIDAASHGMAPVDVPEPTESNVPTPPSAVSNDDGEPPSPPAVSPPSPTGPLPGPPPT